MLVDNGVNGDSRVQKAARSAADAGWQVILLGKSPNRSEQTWRLGEAEVRLIPVGTAMRGRRYESRRAPLRRPLAYRSRSLASSRKQQVRAWRAELYQRNADLRVAAATGRSRLSLSAGRARLVLPRLAARVTGPWVSLRERQTRVFKDGRTTMDAPLDRFTTRFWKTVSGDRVWRRFDPYLMEFELAFGPVIDELRPDLIHAHDFRMIGVGARAKTRALAKGRPVKLLYDAHEYLPGIRPWSPNPRWLLAQCAYEREYISYADALVTVSDGVADLLVKEHGLTERPDIVLNAPMAVPDPDRATAGEGPGLRELCGVEPDTPLVLYIGGAAPQRGLATMIEALPLLEGVHAAFVVNRPDGPLMKELMERAAELGAADRVHAMPYVPYDQVVPFISTADAGVSPMHHWLNHEVALNNKFFEYSHARLPLVVSDVKTLAETVRETGQGEVFEAENPADYARAVREVLADPKKYRAAYDKPGLLEQWTWEAQAEVIDKVYVRLLKAPKRPVAGSSQMTTTA